MFETFDEKLKKDAIFKSVLGRNKKILTYLINNILNEKVEIESILYNETLKRNVKDKASRMDLLVLTKNGYLINIEINTEQDSKYLHIRNFDYIYYLYKRLNEPNNEIKEYVKNIEINKVFQISINTRCNASSEIFDTIKTNYYKTQKEYLPNLYIYTIEIENILKMEYNKDSFLSFLACFDLEMSKIKDLSKKYPIVKEVMIMLEELNKKYDILAAPDQEFTRKLNEKIYYNDGLYVGSKYGEETNRNFMIKNMLNNNIDHKTIAIALGLSIKDAEKVINEVKKELS